MATNAGSFDYRPFAMNPHRGENLKQTIARKHPNLRPDLTADGKFTTAALCFSERDLKPGHDCSARYQSDVKLCVAWWLGDLSVNSQTYWCLVREVKEPQDVLGQKLALERLLWTRMSHPGLRRCLHQSFDHAKNSSVYLFEYSSTSLLAELHRRAHGASRAPRPLLREAEVRQLIAGLASAVDYLHAHNIIVRECALHPSHIIYLGAGRESPFVLENGLLCMRDRSLKGEEGEGRFGEGIRDLDPYVLVYDRNFDEQTWSKLRKEALDANQRLLKTFVKLVHFVVTYMDEDGTGDIDFLLPSQTDDWGQLATEIAEKYPSLSTLRSICTTPNFRSNSTWTFTSAFGDLISAPPPPASSPAKSATRPS